MKIVALFGPQGAGKSEAANALATNPGWIRLSFVDPLYDMMWTFLGVNPRSIDKNASCPALGGKTLRHALQALGTEWGRNMLSGTIWVDHMQRRLDRACDEAHAAGVVIDDLRHANEFTMLNLLGAQFVRIERAGFKHNYDPHSSEADWTKFEWHHLSINDKAKEDWAALWKDTMPSVFRNNVPTKSHA